MPSDRLSGFSSAFDDLLERSRRELDALSVGSSAPALSPTPRASADPSAGSSAASARGAARSVPARSPAAAPVSRSPMSRPAASRSPAERALDEKLGPGWRHEVLDRTREGGELVVRCRVTAPARGVSRTMHGSAPLPGAGGGGASGLSGTAGSVRFSLGAGTGSRDPARADREAERRAIESALAACARLL